MPVTRKVLIELQIIPMGFWHFMNNRFSAAIYTHSQNINPLLYVRNKRAFVIFSFLLHSTKHTSLRTHIVPAKRKREKAVHLSENPHKYKHLRQQIGRPELVCSVNSPFLGRKLLRFSP